MLNVLIVAGGGALGSAARYLLALLALRCCGTAFPVGTLAINVLGCLAAGAAAARLDPLSPWRTFLVSGVLGGFTTFSAFGLETQAMLQKGAGGLATAYVTLSLGLGLGAVLLGHHALSR